MRHNISFVAVLLIYFSFANNGEAQQQRQPQTESAQKAPPQVKHSSRIASKIPQIGDKVVSKDSSLEVTVLKAENADSIRSEFGKSRNTIMPDKDRKLLLITVKLKNLARKQTPTLVLAPKYSTVQDPQMKIYHLKNFGILITTEIRGGSSIQPAFSEDSDTNFSDGEIQSIRFSVNSDMKVDDVKGVVLSPRYPIFLPSGLSKLGVGAWLLETDATGTLRKFSISSGDSAILLLVYSVPPGLSESILSLPGFRSIGVRNISPVQAEASAEKKLYLCEEKYPSGNVLTEECDQSKWTISFFQELNRNLDFSYNLAGDIVGTLYGFNLMLGSYGGTDFDVAIIISHAGDQKETVLTSTSFTATSANFQEFSRTITGIDPMTVKSDRLILRITAKSGSIGAIFIGDKSYITIPSIESE